MGKKTQNFRWPIAVAWLLIIAGFAICAATLWQLNEYYNLSFSGVLNIEMAHKVGSFLAGSAGILWAVAGIIFLYENIKLQRKEFRETHLALKHSNFESTFFNLLSTLLDLKKSATHEFQISGRKQTKNGSEYFREAFKEFKKLFLDKAEPQIGKELGKQIREQAWTRGTDVKEFEIDEFDAEEFIPIIENSFKVFHRSHGRYLDHYFRFIYNIFKYILENFDSDDEESQKLRKKYIGLIQAQLSSDELGLLFFNVLTKYARNKEGELKFKEILDEYNFFENIAFESVILPDLVQLYPNTNFKFLNQRSA